MTTGEATWDEALLLILERNGFPEETYHTFSYSPLTDDHGAISGMLCVVTEVTARVIGERRLGLLGDLAPRSRRRERATTCGAVSMRSSRPAVAICRGSPHSSSKVATGTSRARC